MDAASLISGLFTDLDNIGMHADDLSRRGNNMHLCEDGLSVIHTVRARAHFDERQRRQLDELEAGFTIWLARLRSGYTGSQT